MSDDIVTWLRLTANLIVASPLTRAESITNPSHLREAADEIERLREELIQANNKIKLLIAIETAGKDL